MRRFSAHEFLVTKAVVWLSRDEAPPPSTNPTLRNKYLHPHELHASTGALDECSCSWADQAAKRRVGSLEWGLKDFRCEILRRSGHVNNYVPCHV